jgi:hypothetical protein
MRKWVKLGKVGRFILRRVFRRLGGKREARTLGMEKSVKKRHTFPKSKSGADSLPLIE